jgi:mono/diheme cytochrome c family protein
VDDIANYLLTGHNATAFATGPMAETLAQSTSKMTGADLRAIAAYLKDSPVQDQAAPSAPDQSAMKSGAQIYADECAGCHRADGKGQEGLFPSLNSSAEVQQRDPTSLLRVLLRGTRNVSTIGAPTAPAMPAFSWVLNDEEAAVVLTYIRNSWGNASPAVSAGEARKARHTFVERTD